MSLSSVLAGFARKRGERWKAGLTQSREAAKKLRPEQGPSLRSERAPGPTALGKSGVAAMRDILVASRLRARHLAFPFLPLSLLASPAQADTLIDNVNGISLRADGKVDRFNGVLIGDDGRIEQVLTRSDKRPGKVDYKLDGKGRVLIPGIVDAHLDLMELGLAQLTGEDAPPEAKPRPEDLDLALNKAQQLLLERGVTTVTDMGTTIEDWQAYRRAGDLGLLRLRIVAYAEGADAMILIGGPGPSTWLYEDRLRLNGVRLVLDGAAKVRLSDTQLKNLMSRAAMDNFQVAVEAHGEPASRAVLDAVDELAQTYKGERRWRIEGADTVSVGELPRFARSGVIASVAPERSGAMKPLADAGAKLAFGSGGTLSAPRPFAGLAAAVGRASAAPASDGAWPVSQALPRETALAASTIGAAYAALAEGRLGQIAAGRRADFLLIDQDPLLATPEDLTRIRVLETWVGGKRLYQAREPSAPQAEGR